MRYPEKNDAAFVMKESYSFDELIRLMAFLRKPEEGCPWDRSQTHESLRASMLEEAWEAVDAINSGKDERIMDELGDVLLQVLFHAQIGAEDGSFTMDDVITKLCRKLISRHSHLFGEDHADTPEQVLSTWEKNKEKEKGLKSAAATIDEVPRGLPALSRAFKIQKRAARFGFDWQDVQGPQAKILEEAGELAEAAALTPGDSLRLEEEGGDLLFAVVNTLRHLKVDPEVALGRASDKFARRFSEVERCLKREKPEKELESYSLEELDAVWNRLKEEEKKAAREE